MKQHDRPRTDPQRRAVRHHAVSDLAAGLTLIFGIMGVINLSHGSLYMIGAYAAALIAAHTGSSWLALLGGAGRGGRERCCDRIRRGAAAL